MARPTEKHLGAQARLELATARYFRVYRAVRDRLRVVGGSKHSAYLAVAKNLGTPYDTVKKHYARMRRSIEAAKVAGVEPLTEEAGIIDLLLSLYAIDREPLELEPEEYIAAAFTAAEQRELRRISRAFALRLAIERLELIELRKR